MTQTPEESWEISISEAEVASAAEEGVASMDGSDSDEDDEQQETGSSSTYTLRCTDSLCFRPREALPTDTSASLTVIPG